MAIKAVVFDIGGVLELTPSTGWREKWAARIGLTVGEMRDKMYATWRGGSIGAIDLASVELQTATVLGLTKGEVKALMADLWAEYLGTHNEALHDYFRGLRPAYQTAILSNSFVGAREREQEAYDFENSCDFIIYSHEVGMAKPDPQIYQLLCDRLKLEAHEIVFLDDSPRIVESARAFGLHTVQFESNEQAIAEINQLLSSV